MWKSKNFEITIGKTLRVEVQENGFVNDSLFLENCFCLQKHFMDKILELIRGSQLRGRINLVKRASREVCLVKVYSIEHVR